MLCFVVFRFNQASYSKFLSEFEFVLLFLRGRGFVVCSFVCLFVCLILFCLLVCFCFVSGVGFFGCFMG